MRWPALWQHALQRRAPWRCALRLYAWRRYARRQDARRRHVIRRSALRRPDLWQHALQRRALWRCAMRRHSSCYTLFNGALYGGPRSGRMLYWRRPGLGLGLVSPSRALIREMGLVNVWYEGWMVGARPHLEGASLHHPLSLSRASRPSRARRLDIQSADALDTISRGWRPWPSRAALFCTGALLVLPKESGNVSSVSFRFRVH